LALRWSSASVNRRRKDSVKLRLQYPEFCQLVCNQDSIWLQETKTDDLDTIELPGYIFKMKNKKIIGRKSGGMILAYKEITKNDVFIKVY
jgi:hypothetical protein